MRLLKINNTIVEIDSQTAIGIKLQKMDLKDPGKRFVKVSNEFTIPATVKNLSIFGNPQDPQGSTGRIVGNCLLFQSGRIPQ